MLDVKNCDLCGSARKRLIRVENNFPISMCLDCSLVYVSSIPDINEGRVIGEYYNDIEGIVEKQRNRYEYVIDYLVEVMNKLKPQRGNLLDVGCGFGFLLVAARQCGWSVAGTELSEEVVKYLHDVQGLDHIYYGDLDHISLPDEYYSIINLTNVLEHVPYPSVTLENCKRLLEEEGYIIVRVPNMMFTRMLLIFYNIIKSINPKKEISWSFLASYPPVHLTGFTPFTLKKYFSKCGYQTVDILPSRLSSVSDENALYRVYSIIALVVYYLSLKRLNITPTILGIAQKIRSA